MRLSEALVSLGRRYDVEIAQAKRQRVFRFATIILSACVVPLVAYYAYVNYNREVPADIFNAILWPVVAEAIVGLGASWYAKWSDKFPKASEKIRQDFEIFGASEIARITSEELNKHDFSAIEPITLTERLRRTYQRIVASDPDGWHRTANDRIRVLREIRTEYVRLHTEYVAEIESLSDNVASYFSDATKNLQLLNDVAGSIKARAIEPSFILLERTKESLGKVKREMNAIEF